MIDLFRRRRFDREDFIAGGKPSAMLSRSIGSVNEFLAWTMVKKREVTLRSAGERA